MIAIDTNILVRILVDDQEAERQCASARALIAKAGSVWVSPMVLVETSWVLESVYGFAKPEILSALEQVAAHPRIVTGAGGSLHVALAIFANSNVDFADSLILADALSHRLTLYTFDKKLSRLHGATRVSVREES